MGKGGAAAERIGARPDRNEASGAEGRSMPSALHLLRGIVGDFLSISAVAAVAMALLLYAASQTQNRTAIDASEKLLAVVLENEQRNLARLAKDYTNWDDAIRYLLIGLNEAWADRNIGPTMSKAFDIAAAVVVNGNDETILAMVEGKVARGFKVSDFGPGMADLLRRVRANAGAEAPPSVSGFVQRDGTIEIVGIGVFAREYPDKSPPLPDPNAALIVAKRLDANAMKELAANYDLPGLRLLTPGDAPLPAVLPIADSGGRSLGSMTWTPRLPGTQIIDSVLPQAILGLAVIAGFVFAFVARARKLTRRIERDAERLLRSNAKQAESEQKRERALTIARAGTWEWNIGENRHVWSPEAYRIFGVDPGTPVAPEAILGQIHPDDFENFARQTSAWAENMGSHEGEFRIVHHDGVIRYVRFVAEAIRGDAGQSVSLHGLVQDVTEQRRMEEKLRGIQKVEMLGYLAGGVAHEMNNLLQVILGNIELSRIDFERGKDPQRRLDVVHHACGLGGTLTRQLLTYAGSEFVAPTTIDVRASVDELATTLRQMVGETIEVEIETGDDLWPIFVDRTQLRIAFANLVVNGRDAMPDGGRLSIKAANVHLDEAFSSRRRYDVVAGDYVAISVQDTGTGMSAGVVENAFVPFFTTKEVGKGSGLGLSMVFGFVRRHSGGYVDIESAPGRGTTVSLYFPRAGDRHQEAA